MVGILSPAWSPRQPRRNAEPESLRIGADPLNPVVDCYFEV
jgi:hypothetical protein